MKIKKVRKTRLAPTMRVDEAAQPPVVPPKQYPFYMLPAYQCPECESGVQWETQALDPNPQGIGAAYGSCLSGSIGVACSRAGKRFKIPLLIAYAIEAPSVVGQEAAPAPTIVEQAPRPYKRRPWWHALFMTDRPSDV
jgi:hypothetical protein